MIRFDEVVCVFFIIEPKSKELEGLTYKDRVVHELIFLNILWRDKAFHYEGIKMIRQT